MPTVSTHHSDERKPLVQPGEIIAGKYRVERALGAGAMGEVFAAIHLQLRERVAIKLLRPEAGRFEDAEARFLREARALARIKSEHVARVADVGVTDSGIPAMVMEYLEGSDLQTIVRKQGPLSAAVAVDYILQACEAIAEAHKLGIVHRDIKPANLFLTHRADGSPCIKVLDFGISKVALTDPATSDAAMAQTSMLLGTPFYMSPEQLESTAGVDARTDIWSLGVTLYELLAGNRPFSAPALPQLITKILTASPPSVRRARPALGARRRHRLLSPARSAPALRQHRRDGERLRAVRLAGREAVCRADLADHHGNARWIAACAPCAGEPPGRGETARRDDGSIRAGGDHDHHRRRRQHRG